VTLVRPEDVGLSSAGLRRVDDHLRGYVDAGKLAGTLTLVARRGQIVHLSALGQMDRERGLPMRDDSLFRIYSMTKPVTSVALMRLHEEGAFQLGDPVHTWIPEWEGLRVYRYGHHPTFTTEPAARPITMRDLLVHTSGLSYSISERSGVDAAYRKLGIGSGKVGLREMIARLAGLPLEFSPGSAWGYSVATDVAGYLVEVLGGQRFDDYLREKIFEPLRMADTTFTVPPGKISRFAASYTRTPEKPLALLDDPATSHFARPQVFLSGGAGLVSTATDYFRFAEMLRRGGELDGVRILGPRTVRYMTRNHLPDGKDLASVATRSSFSETRYEGIGFGLGFHVVLDPVRAQVPTSVGEYGWGGMASTAFWVDPAEELVVVFMTQLVPSSTYNLRGPLRAMVYGAIVD